MKIITSFYYRFVYRKLMTLSHKYNWHHTRTSYPERDTLVSCAWCGLSKVMNLPGVVLNQLRREER